MKHRLWQIYCSPGFTLIMGVVLIIALVWACYEVPL